MKLNININNTHCHGDEHRHRDTKEERQKHMLSWKYIDRKKINTYCHRVESRDHGDTKVGRQTIDKDKPHRCQ